MISTLPQRRISFAARLQFVSGRMEEFVSAVTIIIGRGNGGIRIYSNDNPTLVRMIEPHPMSTASPAL